ncbi:MAG: DUF1854 domain-containing protein [Candidatus Coatesbacteria bacterium]
MKKKRKAGKSGQDSVWQKPEPAVTVDGAAVTLVPNADGTLKLVTPGKTWKRVRVRLGRPLFRPDEFATVLIDGEGGKAWAGRGHGGHGHMRFGTHEVALIMNLPGLSPEARKVLEEHRLNHDLTCAILKVNSLQHQFGAAFWDVDTDKGPRQFVIRGTTEHVRWLTDDRMLITDVQGNRFEIPSLNGLDRRSQNQIALIL